MVSRPLRKFTTALNAVMARLTDVIARSLFKMIDGLFISRPRPTLLCLLCVVAALGYFAKDFKIDASSETLIQEDDASMRYARMIASRYGIQDFLFIAYTPHEDMLSEDVLADIKRLKTEISTLERVDSVITILDAPLLESPRIPVKELAGSLPTLESPQVDRQLAREEMKSSPIFRNLLVSPDLKTTAIQVNFNLNLRDIQQEFDMEF